MQMVGRNSVGAKRVRRGNENLCLPLRGSTGEGDGILRSKMVEGAVLTRPHCFRRKRNRRAPRPFHRPSGGPPPAPAWGRMLPV